MNTKLELFKQSVCGKSVGVIGIGISNTPLIKMLVKMGANVTARDKKTADILGDIAQELQSIGVKTVLGEEYLSNITEDIVFKTPGMRIDTPELLGAKERGAIVTSEMEVFFDVCPAKIIAITGSDGKTTTTTLIYKMLTEQGYKCWLGGNIGTPLLSDVENISVTDKVILELSSFQLHSMRSSPNIAVITNLSPNHLDVHKSMEEYITAKENIFAYQDKTDKLVLNYDNEITRELCQKSNAPVTMFSRTSNIKTGVYLKNEQIFVCEDDKEIEVLNINDILLPGVHNVENYMAAIAAVWGLVEVKAIRNIAKNFGGVQHRIEFVREVNDVKYYNDSIASSPTRARAGLYSFDKKVIMIAGGYDKNIPFDDLGNDIVKRVKLLVLMGKTLPKIKKAVEEADGYSENNPPIITADSLKDAVIKATKLAKSGDIIILSPACASFDMFKNFEERGNQFKQIVMELGL